VPRDNCIHPPDQIIEKTFDDLALWHYQTIVNGQLNLRLLLAALRPSRAAVGV